MTGDKRLVRLELEANREGFGELGALVEALSYWVDDPHFKLYEGLLEEKAQGGLLELRVFLQELPGRYGYSSAEEYVLGYKPLGGEVARQDADALLEWNRLQSEVLRIAGDVWHWSQEGRREVIGDLMKSVGQFTADRDALAKLIEKTPARGVLPRQKMRVPFTSEVEEAEGPEV